MDRLDLTEDELCRVLGVDPLTVIAGDLDDKPQLPILLALTEEAAERVGEDVLRRWVRAEGPHGRPVEHLLAGDFPAFEDALGGLRERGFILRGGGREARSGEREAGERKAGEGEAGEREAGEGRPGEGRPGAGGAGDGRPGEGPAGTPG